MEAQNYLIYILVFLMVFIPYVLLSFMVNKPTVPLNQEMAKDWPEFYKRFYGLLSSGVDSLGEFMLQLQPDKAKKLNNYLIIASIVMDVRLIMVAEVLLGVLSPIVFALFGMFVLKNLGAAVALAILGGAIGYIDFTGNMDTCIAIRIAYKKNKKVFVRSGAGIVADSVPEMEFEECLNKARASLTALENAQEADI